MSSDFQGDDPMIRVQGVGKTYRLYDKPHHRLLQAFFGGRRTYFREFAALNDVSFVLQRGETLGIIGPNGAGKSTLLQIICKTLAPSRGQVQVNGRIAALLELGTGFNPEFTGRENVVINAAILGLTPEQIAARMDDILAFADIGDFMDQPVKTYSSGMYVRLAFSVVIHVNPDILIVDEALAVGDALFQAKCMTRMRRMLDDGLTLLFISHDIAAVKALCRRALWLEQGRVRAMGDTAEVTRDYDQDWIRKANAAQEDASSAGQQAQLFPQPGQQAVGTGVLALLAHGWGSAGAFGTEARVRYGDTLRLRLRLQVRRPCRHLVVSYHIKNRQNQHVLGGHSADEPSIHGRSWEAGDVFELAFDMPIYLHQGDYVLTVLAASMTDVEHYSDAVFHLWADDVASLQVMARNRFPLSDLVEPPRRLKVTDQAPWVILDDYFPNLLTGFRVAEYNAHLQAFPQLSVLSSLDDFLVQHERYACSYPDLAARVRPWAQPWLAGVALAYVNFLNNACHFLPFLHQQRLPFVLTLYPGGGFGLDEPESDRKLAEVLASDLLQAIIVTQPVTRDYLLNFARVHGLNLAPVHQIDGVVVNPLYFEPPALGAPRRVPAAGANVDAPLQICFVAERYMARGANKGYPEFIAAALALSELEQLRWHVVGGGFTAEELDVSALGDRIVFHGRLDTPELRAFFDGMDLIISPNRPGLLHPGNFDGFPTGSCVEASLCGVAIMATDALDQNPGYVDGVSMLLLDPESETPLAVQIEESVRRLCHDPGALARIGLAGQALSRQLYAPQRQIGARQQVLREVAQRLGIAGQADAKKEGDTR